MPFVGACSTGHSFTGGRLSETINNSNILRHIHAVQGIPLMVIDLVRLSKTHTYLLFIYTYNAGYSYTRDRFSDTIKNSYIL